MLYLRYADYSVTCAAHRNRLAGGCRELKGLEIAAHMRTIGNQEPCEDCAFALRGSEKVQQYPLFV